jgi:predicted KAP-like P-loop ATPase
MAGEHIKQKEFHILVDKPLENGDEDRFGHRDIAVSLLKIVKQAPRPFNIGLYGQWGVGKSTICKIIQEDLEKDSDYEVVYFDTWKYERDSFRRQFLINLDEE